MIQFYVAKTITEYIDLIISIQPSVGEVWYRGHSKCSYKLLPSGLRNTVPYKNFKGDFLNNQILMSQGYEVAGVRINKMLNEFKRRSTLYLDYMPKNDFEYMFIAQHYGLPTRLLDFTTDPLVALFFALSAVDLQKEYLVDDKKIYNFINGDIYFDSGIAIYIVNPRCINHETVGVDNIIDVVNHYDDWKRYVDPQTITEDFPICIQGVSVDKRIVSQSGKFILWGRQIKNLEEYSPLKKHICKILIPYNKCYEMYKALHILGVTASSIYPDLEHLSKDIYYTESEEFNYLLKSGDLFKE